MQYVYDTLSQEPKNVVTSCDGDGVVPLLSLQAASDWKLSQKAFIVEGASHTGILWDQDALNHVLEIA